MRTADQDLDHAVSASTVYLIRSLGTVYGVAITSAIVQTTLSVRLPDALGEIPDKWRVRPFSMSYAMRFKEKAITDHTRDTYIRARCRLSMRFGTRSPPSGTCPRISSSRRATCITMGSGTRLRCPRRSLLLLLSRLSWPRAGDCAARSNAGGYGQHGKWLPLELKNRTGALWELVDGEGNPRKVSERRTSSCVCLDSKTKIEGPCSPIKSQRMGIVHVCLRFGLPSLPCATVGWCFPVVGLMMSWTARYFGKAQP